MYTNNKLAKSIRLALMFGATATAMTGIASAQDQEQDEEAAERVERIQVTGSRIQRTDMEGALPVTVIDRQSIELSGEISAADLIRNTTFNSAGSFRPQSGSSAQGVSQVNMRGLGASRTLVLVDGRRLTMSPSTGSSQDLNSIPMGAIERIEILSDGASAVYGSDAIGGVINVITRRDFNGAELTIGAGQVSVPRDGGDRENGSAVFGASSDTTSVIGGVSWNKRDIIFERDYHWVQPGSSIYGNNWRPASAAVFREVPGGCEEDNFFNITVSGLERCQYNFNATNANEASTSNESLFLKVQHDINNDWRLYSNASIAKTSSFGRYAPAPDSNIFYSGLATPADSYNNPTNPNAWMYDPRNPNSVAFDPSVGDPQDVFFYHRFAAMGNRDSEVDNENVDFLVGAEGRVGGFDLDFGVRRVRNKTSDIGNGYLAASTAWSNVNNFNPGYCSDGSFDAVACRFGYDIQSPSKNPQDILSAGVVTISRISTFDIDEIYASAGFEITEIGGGMMQGFVGIERRDERYQDKYDSQSEAGLVGGSAGNSAGGGRDVTAAYFEILAPLTYDLEMSVAGRFDDYSDYGSDFSPKVSLRWQPMDNLLLRGSYGLGFRAPTLDVLTQLTSFSADSVFDARTCEVLSGNPNLACQVNAFYIANPDLDSESSTQFSLGVAYQPTDWMNFTVDYYNIEIDDRIRSYTSQNLIDAETAGDPIPAGLGVTRDSNGAITRIDAGFGNAGTLETSGLDINVRTQFDFGDMGALTSNLSVSHIIDYKVDGGRNEVKDRGLPQQRITLQNQYTWGDFTAAWNINVIGTQYTFVEARNDEGVFPNCTNAGANVTTARCGNWGTWTTHDLQLSYNTPWNGRVTVGAQNVFEKLPKINVIDGPEYGFGGRGYNFNLYNAFGRVTYVRYTQRF